MHVFLDHRGYVIKLFGKLLRLPLEWLVGSGYAEEKALSDECFCMYMDIRDPLLGKLYAYSGEFTVTEVTLNE